MGHDKVLLVLTLLVPGFFAVTMVFNGLGSVDDNVLYESSTSELSDKYNLEITPAGWTFSVWGIIYLWQALWILYAIVNLFRKREKEPYYTNPILLPVPFLVIYIVNLTLNCGWLIAFDREQLELAFAILFLIALTLVICLFFSYRSLDRETDVLIKMERKSDVWLTRLLVQNGLSIYATWTTIATHLNLAFVLAYRSAHDIGVKNSSTIALSVLSGVILIFLVTDWFFLDRYTRYTFTPYLVLIWALFGVLSKNYEAGARNTTFTMVLIGVSGAAALVKLFLMIWRHCRKTENGDKITDTTDVTI